MNAAQRDDVIRCSFVPQRRFVGAEPRRGTFDELEHQLRKHGQTIDDKDGPGVVMSTFHEGAGTTPTTAGKWGRFRQEALIDETWLLGLDFDTRSGDPLDLMAPLQAAGVDVIAYSSHSHGRFDALRVKVAKELAKKPLGDDERDREVERRAHAPRFRVLVRFARSVTPAEYRALWAWLDRYLGGGSDESCSDPTRLYFTPRRKAPDAELDPWIVRWRGAPLDPDKLPDGSTVGELMEAWSAAGAPSPRSELAPAEQERRRAQVLSLPHGQRTSAEKRARRHLEATLSRIQTATEGGRRKGLFSAACRIGEWAHVIGDSGVNAWRDALLDVARWMPDPDDHARQVDNGIHRGRGNPVDVRDELAKRPRALPIITGDGVPMPLDDARARLVELVAEAVQTRGVCAIAADPGVGKTRAVLELLPRMWLEGMSVRLAVPTNKLADEVLKEIRRVVAESDLSHAEARAFLGSPGEGGHPPLVGIEPKRHAQNCQNFAAVNAGRRAGGINGARTVCHSCDLHPRNSGNMTACRFYLEVLRSQDYRVTVTTHALEVLRTAARTDTVVDVAAFRKADREGGRWIPHARWTADGLTLTLKADDTGAPPPVLEGSADEVEAQCRAWLADVDGLPCSDDLDTLRGKLAPAADDETDLLVIDEAPRAADEHRTVRASDLLTWRGAGDVIMTDEVMDAIRGAMTEARERLSAVGSMQLQAAVPPDALTVRRLPDGRVWSKVGDALVQEHAATAATGAIPLALRDAPEAEALEALEAACRRGWSGCYIDPEGKLHLTLSRSIGGEGTRATVYLDGTATEASARALLGGACRFERIRAALHPDTRVVRVDWSAATRELPPMADDARTSSKRRATLRRLEAVIRRYESPTTAWVLHKAWCDDDDVRALLDDAFTDGRVVYFRAPEATGSNKLAGCTRIVLADWFVPRAVVEALAETLQDRAKRAELDADWQTEAAHQLEGAELLQAAYRVRPVQNARELVLLSERDPPAGMGWPAADVIDPDELVADELGLLPPGRKGAAMLLAREVAGEGVVALGSRFKAAPHLAYESTGERGRGPETALESAEKAWADHGRAQAWAEAAGVALDYCRTGNGGAPIPVFYAVGTPPDVARVARALPPAPWFEWRGARLELEDQTTPILELLASLPLSIPATFDDLAARAGVSVSTVRRRLATAGLRSGDDLRAYRDRAQTPDHVVVDDGIGESRIAIAGSREWLQRASPAAVNRWRQLHTGPPAHRPAAAA
jgi:hypothetical protein